MLKILFYIYMLFIFSTPLLIRHLWQLKTLVFLQRCLLHAVIFSVLEWGNFKWDITLLRKSERIMVCRITFNLQDIQKSRPHCVIIMMNRIKHNFYWILISPLKNIISIKKQLQLCLPLVEQNASLQIMYFGTYKLECFLHRE